MSGVCNCGVTEGIHHASCPIGIEHDKALYDAYERERLVPSELSKMLPTEESWSVGNGGSHDVVEISVLFRRTEGLGYVEMMNRARDILKQEIDRVSRGMRKIEIETRKRAHDTHKRP